MAVYKARALVLRRIPLGEKDKIVTLFTREFGKVRAVAKGARKTTSRLAGASEPLMLLDALLAEGASLDILSQAEVRESFPKVRGDYGLVLRASYLCELIDKVMEERDPHPDVFDLLATSLFLLQDAAQPDAVLHAAEMQLMAMIGYEPRLDVCVRCERDFGPEIVPTAFSPLRGGALCEGCADAAREDTVACDRATIAALDRLAMATDHRALTNLVLPAALLGRINRLLRDHLRLRLERDLRSTGFLDALRLEEAG